uniref:Uncharacterized protein n=1 Tax=Cannabis sativa TaxID=3483 RepID=A0A803Q7N8_CANSA
MRQIAALATFYPANDPALLLGLQAPWPVGRIIACPPSAGPGGGGGSDGLEASSPREFLTNFALTRLVGSSKGLLVRPLNVEDMSTKRK